jgi:hypothetical protein
MTFTQYQMPTYTHDQAAYQRQMRDWHMRMHHYHDQLRNYHLERARHFHGLTGGHHAPRPEDVA